MIPRHYMVVPEGVLELICIKSSTMEVTVTPYTVRGTTIRCPSSWAGPGGRFITHFVCLF